MILQKKYVTLFALFLVILVNATACGGLTADKADDTIYTIAEKIENKPTIPVFFPWSGASEGKIACNVPLWFDCDTAETPYSLVWISLGIEKDLASTETNVSQRQTDRMRSDSNTIYLVSEEWHYWNPGWRTLSSDSPFYLDEIFDAHTDTEYGTTHVINFEHPEWPALLAAKASSFQAAGFDGMMLDWWHNHAGNGRDEADVQAARMAIAKAIREEVGEDFIIMGNVNWKIDDPTSQYISAVFLELWKTDPAQGYVPTYADEAEANWDGSIERMEDLLLYWNDALQEPKLIAFEPWKITTADYIEDRYTEENEAYARLYTAMVLVIADNGYMLYSDDNADWGGGDHQHAYYDFYLTDFGGATSGMIPVMDGVAYKTYERGIIAYNRTLAEVPINLPDGREIWVGPLEGKMINDK